MVNVKNCVIALGYFDSIHLGHRRILRECKKIAYENHSVPVLFTFDDGFLKAVGREEEEVFLLQERRLILREEGIENIIVLPADRKFLSANKNDFLQYLDTFSPIGIVVGKDYKFGKGAEGTVNDIVSFFYNTKTQVKVCDLVEYDGDKISTTDIKKLLKEGDIKRANLLLSHPFFYMGKVISGRKKGTELGIPTINIELPMYKIKIKSGVYVTETYIDKNKYCSVTNVGTHPTFMDDHFNIETHLIDCNVNLYEKTARIDFIDFLREIIVFDDQEKLVKQIQNDINHARGLRI